MDLHIDTMIPERLWGYDPNVEHRHWLGGRFFGHLDVPRMAVADSMLSCGRSQPIRFELNVVVGKPFYAIAPASRR